MTFAPRPSKIKVLKISTFGLTNLLILGYKSSEEVLMFFSLLTKSSAIDSRASLSTIRDMLNRSTHASRVRWMRETTAADQARLWDMALHGETSLVDLVPEHIPDGQEVVHEGYNSLPAFRDFQKRFCRPHPKAEHLFGYNEGLTRPLIGPGFFVVDYFAERREVGVNYYKVPQRGAKMDPSWPEVKANEDGLQRFVYANMIDFLRKVSDHVTIGRAFKHQKAMPNYFLLCREDKH